MGNFLAELKRRHMYRVAAAYAVVAWVLLQLFNNLQPVMKLPDWAGTLVLVFLVGGFPVVLLLAWARELAPADLATGPLTTGRLDWVLIGALVLVIALLSYQQLAGTTATQTQQASVIPPASLSTTGISIAVLPFANLSGDSSQEFFSDGMTEEITAALAKVPNLRVVARTSAFQFKGQNRDIQAIGQSLRASHVIEGSVRKEGDRIRITAQLIEAANGLTVWTENYDRQLAGVFATQEDIAQAIAGALRVPLGLRQGETLVRNRTDDLDSYQQYLRARALYRARAINEAVGILEPVVARDPNFAPAWAQLALAYSLVPSYELGLFGASIEEARRVVQSSYAKAEMAAREAMRLDQRHAGGYVALAFVQSQRKNWAAADDLFRQAQALDPDDPDTIHLHSITLVAPGRLKLALSMRERLRALEPFVPIYNVSTAFTMQMNGQSEAAIQLLQATSSEGAVRAQRNVFLSRSYAAAGRYGDAADTLLAIPQNQNMFSRRSVEDAARLLRGAAATTTLPEALPLLEGELNFVYAHIGASSRVLDFPERNLEIEYANAAVNRSVWYPLYASVRKSERFKEFVRKGGFVDYWRERGWPDLCRPMGTDDFVCD
jgi:TolB-like protein